MNASIPIAFDAVHREFPPEGTAEHLPELQDDSAESCAARTEMSACVREFVERLPAQSRAVLVLSEVEGLSDAELLSAIRDQLDTLLDEAARAELNLREASAMLCRAPSRYSSNCGVSTQH